MQSFAHILVSSKERIEKVIFKNTLWNKQVVQYSGPPNLVSRKGLNPKRETKSVTSFNPTPPPKKIPQKTKKPTQTKTNLGKLHELKKGAMI